MDVTCVVATHGDDQWKQLAESRALPSAQEADFVVQVHISGGTLAEARNHGLAQVRTPFVAFLDGDDQLEPGYFDAMATGTADLRAPAVRYVPWGVRGHVNRAAKVPQVAGHKHACQAECLAFGNFLVIGSVVRTELLRSVGGFKEYAWSEDWAAWAACWQAGGTVESIPSAVYRAHVRAKSRNRGSMSQREKHRVHQDIARDLGLPVPA